MQLLLRRKWGDEINMKYNKSVVQVGTELGQAQFSLVHILLICCRPTKIRKQVLLKNHFISMFDWKMTFKNVLGDYLNVIFSSSFY